MREILPTQGLAWDGGTTPTARLCCPVPKISVVVPADAPAAMQDKGWGEDGEGLVVIAEPTAPGVSEQDEALLHEVRDGNEEAARTLVERLYPLIVRVVRSHLPRRTQEEDLVQAVFAKMFRALGQFSGKVPLEHWVSRIAVNTCLNQLKHEAIRPELRMGDLSEEEEAVVQHLACTDEEIPEGQRSAASDLLATLMARLRPDERLVITLLHLEEKSVDEVRAITGWSGSLVKVKAFRARNRMRVLCRELGLRQEW